MKGASVVLHNCGIYQRDGRTPEQSKAKGCSDLDYRHAFPCAMEIDHNLKAR